MYLSDCLSVLSSAFDVESVSNQLFAVVTVIVTLAFLVFAIIFWRIFVNTHSSSDASEESNALQAALFSYFTLTDFSTPFQISTFLSDKPVPGERKTNDTGIGVLSIKEMGSGRYLLSWRKFKFFFCWIRYNKVSVLPY